MQQARSQGSLYRGMDLGRGGRDYFASHDLEDVISVIDGRPELCEFSVAMRESLPCVNPYPRHSLVPPATLLTGGIRGL
jgi:hypothetical protein